MIKWIKRHWKTAGLFLLCVLAAFLMRTWHYNTSVHALGKQIGDVPEAELVSPSFLPAYHPNFSPFTIESAMMYSYAKDIALGKGVPASDPLLNGMEHIPPYGQMSMGLEWYLGWGWRLKNMIAPDPAPTETELRYQDHPRMAQWMSGQLRLWASLSSGLIFLWLILLGCPAKFAVLAGLLHAVSPAAIARSTGQDFVRGEFCIPLILLSFVLAYSIYRKRAVWKYVCLFLTVVLAFAAWDLCQLLFGSWAVYEILRCLLGRTMNRNRLAAWIVIASAILSAALFVPVCQVYELWKAQFVWTVLPVLFVCFIPYFRKRKWFVRISVAAGLFLILQLFWSNVLNTPDYASIYSHFSEAMSAKLQYWNVKPLNPERLSYDARILWTPSMTSATWETAGTFFPTLRISDISFRPLRFLLNDVPLGLGFFAVLLSGTFLFGENLRRTVKRNSESSLLPILFTLGFMIGFIYIVRYHEFLIIFLVMALALLCRDYRSALSGWVRHLPLTLFCALLCYETVISCKSRRLYTGDVAMRDTAELIAWMRENKETFAGHGVAANITVGPMLRAYAGTGVVLNPQFGIKEIRDATEEYYMTLYHGTEQDLAGFCKRRNVRFVLIRRTNPDEIPPVLAPGLLYRYAKSHAQLKQLKRFYTSAWVYSMRYIANAAEVPAHAVFRQLYQGGKGMKLFRPVGQPVGNYAVFEWTGETE